MARMLGEAFIVISTTGPDRAQVDADVRRATTGLNPQVNIGTNINTAGLAAAMAALMTRLRAMNAGSNALADILDINIPQGRLQAQLFLLRRLVQQSGLADMLGVNLNDSEIAAQLAKIDALSADIDIGANTSPAIAAVAGLTTQIHAATAAGGNNITIGANTGSAIASVAGLQARIAALSKTLSTLRIGANDAQAESVIARLQARLAALSDKVASITMSADTTKLDAQIASEEAKLAGLRQSASDLQVDADTKAAAAKLAGLQKQIAGLYAGLDKLDADVDVTAALTKIYALEAQVKALKGTAAAIKLNADDTAMIAQIAATEVRLAELRAQAADVKLGASVDTTSLVAADAQLLALNAAAEKFQTSLSSPAPSAALTALQARAADLAFQLAGMVINANNKDAVAKLAALQAQAAKLESQLSNTSINFDDASIARAAASLAALDAASSKLTTALTSTGSAGRASAAGSAAAGTAAAAAAASTTAAVSKTTTATRGLMSGIADADAAIGVFTRGSRDYAGSYGLITGQIKLFGGALDGVLPKALSEVSVLHALADGAIEITAVWVPAALAVSAFGIAAAQTAEQIGVQMKNLAIVSTATGQAIGPLTNNFKELQTSVKPQVYQLFGEALVEAGHNTGAFQLVAQETGTAMDQLGARFVYATTQGKGISDFAKSLAPDFAKLGDSIGNFFGILGNLLKTVPGYAQVLLTFGDNILHVIEVFTAAAEPVIKFGLVLHGAVLYSGLAVTAFLVLVSAVGKLGAAFLTFGTEGSLTAGINGLKTFGTLIADGASAIYTYGAAMVALAGEEGIATVATQLLDDSQVALSKVPTIVWVLAAAAAIAALVVVMQGSATASAQLSANLQDLIKNAQLSDLASTIMQAQATSAANLAAANKQLAPIQAEVNNNIGNLAGLGGLGGAALAGLNDQLGTASQNASDAAKGLAQINAEGDLVTSRVDALAKTYGSNAAALGALNAAGITSAQITDSNAQHWAEALIQVNATTQAYQAMGEQAGTVGNDLDVLGRTVTQQYVAIQKLNQGWNQFISDVTGTQGTFDTVALGMTTLANDESATATNADKVTTKLGALSQTVLGTASNIDGMSAADLALNQAFGDQVKNTDALFASWRTAGIAGQEFTNGVAAAIAPMEKYANGSQEATAQLVALAEEAGYQGPNSLKMLNQFLGITSQQLTNTSTDTQTLKDTTNQATIQEALLTTSMQAQGAYIANQLINDIQAAILKYDGVQQAAEAYGNAIAQDGAQSDAAEGARLNLIHDLETSGQAAGDSTAQIATMIAKVLGIPQSAAVQIIMSGVGNYTITGSTTLPTPNGNESFAQAVTKAAGGLINQGTGPTADDVPLLASKGEYVVQAAAVRKYGTGMMDSINQGTFAGGGMVGRYASGGLVENGNTAVLSGDYADTMYDSFSSTMTSAMVAAMQSTITASAAAASAAAASAGGGISGAGVSNSSAYAALQSAAAKAGWTGAEWQALVNVENREAGFSLTATNPTSGAYGMAQFIDGPSEYAQYGGNSTTAAGQAVAMVNYIKQRYGDPEAAWAHEVAYGWYDRGGLLPTGASLVFNGTGKPETVVAPHQMDALTSGLGDTVSSLSQLIGLLGGSGSAYSGLGGALSGLGGSSGILAQVAKGLPGTFGNAAGTDTGGRGAFGLTTTDIGLPPVASTSTGSTAATGTDSTATGSTTGTGSTGTTAAVNTGIKGTTAGNAWLASYAKAQNTELAAYYAFTAAFANSLPKAKAGSWLAGHKAGITEELGTLKKRQSAEEAAYDAVTKSGAQAKYVSHFTTMLRDLNTTLKDQDLSYTGSGGQIGLWRKLTTDTGALSSLAGHIPPAPASSTGSSSSASSSGSGTVTSTTAAGKAASSAGKAWVAAYMKAQNDEYANYMSYTSAYTDSLPKAVKGSWLYNHKAGITSELKTLAARQSVEEAAYDAVLKSGAQTANVGHFTTTLNDLTSVLGDQDLDYSGAGGQRARWQNVSGQVAYLSALAKHIPAGVPVTKMAGGGIISEPITGIGANTGSFYQLGERGPETVTPGAGGGGGSSAIVAELRALRSQMNQLTQVAAQAPAATGQHVGAAVNGAAGAAVWRGRYPRQGA